MEERDWEELEEEVREEPGEAEEEQGSSGEEDPSLERSRFQGEGVLAYIFNNFAAWPLLTPEEERRLLALYLMSRKSLAPLAEALDLTPEEVEVGVRRRAMRDWGVPGEGEGGIAERDVPKELRKHYALVYQGEEARMRLVLSNARLVVSIAKKYAQKWPSVPMEDIIQEGFNGLFKAIDRFDLKLANKLSTYASWWIRDAVEKGVRRYLFVHRTDAEEGSKEYFVLSLDERVVEGEEDRYADLLPAPRWSRRKGRGTWPARPWPYSPSSLPARPSSWPTSTG